MARINGNLDRSAARKTPVTTSQHRGKRNAAAQTESSAPPKKRKRQVHADASPHDGSGLEQHDPSHATPENSRVRIDQVIHKLARAGKDTLVYCETTPLKSEPQVHPPALDLGLIKLSTAELQFLDDSVLYGYLTSNDFLPCIAQWKKKCINDPRLRSLLLSALPDDEYPFVQTATYLAQEAPKYVNILEERHTLNHPHAEIILICLKYVWRPKRCIMAQFMHFLPEAQYPRLEEFIYMFCARALLTVYADLRLHGVDGFFAIMIDSRFAEPMTLEARRAWDRLLILPSSSSGANTAASVSTIQAASIAYAKHTGFKSHATPLSEDEALELQFKVETECWKLKNAFIDAVGEDPDLKVLIPPEVGQAELSKIRRREKKAGPTPQFTLKPVTHCYPACRPASKLHTQPCVERKLAAQEQWQKAKGDDVEADVPDQEPARVDFTFQQKQSTLIPPEQVISRFNQRDVVEPFSDDEKLVALRRFRMVLDLNKGDVIDGAFEWTMISKVLAGRSVADCVRFYYQHKHIIFMKLETRPDPEQPFVPTGVPGPELSADTQIATLQADRTDLRIRKEMLEEDAVRMCSSEIFHRKRGDDHMQSCRQKDNEIDHLKGQLKAAQRQKNEGREGAKKQLMGENENLKQQLAESKAYAETQEKLAAESKEFGEWQDKRADDYLADAKRLEEELREVRQQLRSKTSHAEEPKRDEKPKVEQHKPGPQKVEQHKLEKTKYEERRMEMPRAHQPAVQQSTARQPGVQRTTVQQQAFQQRAFQESRVRQQPAQQQAFQQSRVQQQAFQQPGVQQPRVQQSGVQQSRVQQSRAQQSRVQQLGRQQQAVQQQAVPQQAVQQPTVQQPGAQQPGAQQPVQRPPVRYGEMPEGYGFLKHTTHTHIPRQWRGGR